MRFGVFDHLDRGPGTLREDFEHRLMLAELYDAHGFHAYHQAEHHSTPLGAASSPSVFLAALAQRTKRLRFGPLVYTLPLYHPLRLFEEICMLDHMSGGRLEVGVGRGISPHEVRFYGLDPATVQAQYIEALGLILKALASEGQELTHHGAFYHFDAVPITVGPVQAPHPPLWYGIARPDGVPWCAENRVNAVGNLPAPAMRAVADRYRAEWAALGRSEATLPFLGTSRHMVVAATDAEALALARRAYLKWIESFMYLWKLRGGIPPNANFPPTWDDMAARGQAFCGSPATMRDLLAQDIPASGINYLLCRFAFGDMLPAESRNSVELFVREVMPAFARPAQVAA